MLRIDPAYPLLWRSTTTVQLGTDAAAVIDIDHPWQLTLLRELQRGIPESAVEPVARSLGVPQGEAEALIARVGPALDAASDPVPEEVGVLFACERSPAADDAIAGLELAGLLVRIVTDASVRDGWRGPVVVLAQHVLDPRRVAALMSEDLRHVPIVFTGVGVTVGPVIVPGLTPCTTCIALARRDADSAWPAIAGQLLGLPAPRIERASAIEAGIAAAGLMRDEPTDRRRSNSVALELVARRARRTTRTHRAHPECGCRSLAGNETAAVLSTLEPRTPREYARPA